MSKLKKKGRRRIKVNDATNIHPAGVETTKVQETHIPYILRNPFSFMAILMYYIKMQLLKNKKAQMKVQNLFWPGMLKLKRTSPPGHRVSN